MESDNKYIIEYLKRRLNEKRFLHSLNTAKEAVLLAIKYGGNEEKAYTAGLLHDAAKGMSEEALLEYADDNGVEVDNYERQNPELMHGKIGAEMARNELAIADPEILSAIRWHTTGHAGMTLLEKIVYIADIIEPSRNFEDIDIIRGLAYKDIDAAMVFALEHVIEFVKSRGFSLHPESLNAYNDLKVKGGIY